MSTERPKMTNSEVAEAKFFAAILALIAACPTITFLIMGGYQLLSK